MGVPLRAIRALLTHHTSNASLHYLVKYYCQLLNITFHRVVWQSVSVASGSFMTPTQRNDYFIANFLLSVPVKEFILKIGQFVMKLLSVMTLDGLLSWTSLFKKLVDYQCVGPPDPLLHIEFFLCRCYISV